MESTQIRNIAVVGHGDAGKTSFVSSVLFTAGETKRFLSVNEGNTVTDFNDDEISRKISISTGICSATWKKHKINLLDTPGYSDFICDAFPALRSAETAVFVINTGTDSEFNLERLWEADQDLPKARVFLVNKLDRENSSFEKSIANVSALLSNKSIIPIALPVGKEAEFNGFVDLLDQKLLTFEPDSAKKPSVGEVPADMADAVEEARTQLIETVAEADDDLLEKYLEGEEITSEELLSGLKLAIAEGMIYPAIPICATKNIGTTYFLDLCLNYLPDPTMVSREFDGKEITCDADGTLIAQVFKTIIDPYTGKISVFKVYSGTLKPDTTYQNLSRDENEKISGCFHLQGKNQTPAEMVVAGDIAAAAKLKVTRTGDTLSDSGDAVLCSPIEYPTPLMSMAFTPATKSDEEKISISLTRLAEEDPTLRYERKGETNQLIVSGMGQLHLDVTQDRLKRKFGVTANVSIPKIPYRETVKGRADVRYRHKKQSGGAGQFGEVAIRLLPLPKEEAIDDSGLLFVDMIVGGVIPGQYIPSVEKGIRGVMGHGILAGYKVTGIKVELYDGKSHPVDSKDIAFQIAGAQALKKAFTEAKPILLEPIMNVDVTVPEKYMGDIIGDLNSKRGKVLGMNSVGKKQVIKAAVPMAELVKYEPELRSMTGGRGSFTMEFAQYEELPGQLADAVIAAAKKDED